MQYMFPVGIKVGVYRIKVWLPTVGKEITGIGKLCGQTGT